MIVAKLAKSESSMSEAIQHVRSTARLHRFTARVYFFTVQVSIVSSAVVAGLLLSGGVRVETVYAFAVLTRTCTELAKESHQTVSQRMKESLKQGS